MFKKYSPEQTAQRWKELAELTKFKTALNEGGSLLYTVTAPNGVTYSIVKENANYFIKHTNVLKEAYNVNDFKYMGTMDKMLEKHSAFSMAKKRLEGLIHQIKEDMKYNLLLEEMNQDDKKLLNDFEEVDKETPEEKESVETTTTPEEIDAIEPEIPMGDEEETNGDLDSELDASSEEIPMGDETEEEPIDDKTQVDSERDEDGSPEKIQSLLGKLQNQINNLPEMSPALTKNILNTIITSTKEGIMKLDDNEKDDLIKRIEKDGEKLDEEDIVLEIEIPETKNNFQKLEELIQKKLKKKKVHLNIDDNIIKKDILDESFLDTVKYGISKLGRYKVNGKFFGRKEADQEAARKIQQIIDKKGNEVIKKLDDTIRAENPEFPNNKDPQKFLGTVMSIATLYDSLVESTKKNPNDEGYLPVDAANGIISDLREYVKKFLDTDLAAIYSTVNEEKENLLNEKYELNEEQLKDLDKEFGLSEANDIVYSDSEVRKNLAAKKGDGPNFASTRMDTLKSNKLPLTLAGVGSALGGFSWLVNTEWFKSFFQEIVQTKSLTYVKEIIEKKSEVFASIKPGEGMTQIMNRLNNLNLSPNSSPQDFLNGVKQLGGGDLQKGIDALCQQKGIFPNPEGARQALEAIANNPNGYGKTLGDVFQGNMAGTGKQIGDLLVTQTGGNLSGLVVNTIVQAVPKIITTTAIKTGAAYFALKGLGAVLGPIGIGLMGAGALVKFMRVKGQKSSRAATLDALYQSLRDLKGGILEPQKKEDEEKTGDKNSALYGNIKSLFQFIVNNKNVLGTGVIPQKGNRGDRSYKGGQVMRGGDRAKTGGETQSARKQFFANKELNKAAVRESHDNLMFEGKYFKNQNVLKSLIKGTSFDKIKKFEDLINRVELIRNSIKKMGTNSGDKVIDGFLKQLQNNPIMLTDFVKLFSIEPNDQKRINIVSGMIKEILITVYSSEFKFGNIVSKMATLGGGNINKVQEDASYSASDPNKNFLKDAQSITTFKNNLVKFLSVLIGLFQYLHKLMKQGTIDKNTKEPLNVEPPIDNSTSNTNQRQGISGTLTEKKKLDLLNELTYKKINERKLARQSFLNSQVVKEIVSENIKKNNKDIPNIIKQVVKESINLKKDSFKYNREK